MTLKYVPPTEDISIAFSSLSQWQAEYLNAHLNWWEEDRVEVDNKDTFAHITYSLIHEDWTVHSDLELSYEVMGQFNDIFIEE